MSLARICPLFSSSDGNSTLIGAAGQYILIDAGVSAKALTCALTQHNVSPAAIKAIFVTHEHSDHIKGIRLFAGRNRIPVYATAGTLAGMQRAGVLEGVTAFELTDNIEVGGMTVHYCRTLHDTKESCCYTVDLPDGRRAAVATDMGRISDAVHQALSGCGTILIESNHDISLLRSGPYPPYLKQRILSDYGHLSNDVCAAELPKLAAAGCTRFILGHASKENNRPELAYNTALAALTGAGLRLGYDFILSVAPASGGEMVIF